MLDQSLVPSHFIGRDGFRWWIGQIPPLSSMGKQVSNGGWGNRFKVRIFGYHPYSEVDLPNEDLPWAQCLIPTTSGSGAANCSTGVQLQQGDVVLGFFLDGDNAQVPVILATFGRTSSVPSLQYSSPFVPFTGFSGPIAANPKGPKQESNEPLTTSSPSPQDVSPEQAQRLSEATGQEVISINSAIGDIIPLANTVQNTKLSNLKSIFTNLINFIKRIGDSLDKVRQAIQNAADKIVTLMNEFVGKLMNTMITYLKDILAKGVDLLYKLVFSQVLAATGNPVAAHLAGVAAQSAMVSPVKLLEDSFACIAGAIIDQIRDVVVDIITSAVESIDRFVSCIEDQLTGTLLNTVINTIESLILGPLSGVEKLLQFFGDFNVGETLRSSVSDLAGSGAAFDCNQKYEEFKGMVNQWVVGAGPKYMVENPFQGIQEIVNIQKIGAELGECFSGALKIASAPIINIFGGVGSGAKAVPIFGNLVQDKNGNVTASVIGVQITDPGSGYTFPPFIEIVDDNNQGYGAIARSLINRNGELEQIYMVSEGENYSVGDIKRYSIVDVYIENGGSNYKDAIVTDNRGNSYNVQIANGQINKVLPLNNNSISPIPVDYFPVLSVSSNTGSGAILRPIFASLNVDQNNNVTRIFGENTTIQTSIDCPR